ncbi:MAG: polyprenyl diphosphate synthase [Dehalococcoidales bacterium]|nr:polyprenyl diphosphate synthase [Dehalococcoidales bacterium]
MEEISRLPNHIAFIMDGNGRWAEKRGLPRLEGHRAGLEATRSVVEHLGEYHIKYVTLYSFSTENWNRPKAEVGGLLNILERSMDKETKELHKRGVKIRHLGHLERLPQHLRQAIENAIELTRNNAEMTLSLAFDYGGRLEILDAVRSILADSISPENIDEKLFNSYLYTANLPDVDLVVRTGGDLRISNFLLWQSAYSEYYFTSALWPDFNTEELGKALIAYSQRQRRFGGL